MEKVFFIGPHPDDIDFGCAVSMHDHYLRNDEITTVVLTEGEKGGTPSDRLAEQRNSFNILAPGSRNVFFNFPDTKLFLFMHDIIRNLRELIFRNPPDVVYIPSAQDFHQDHIVTHQCAIAALNNIKARKVLSYETPSTTPKFVPNFFKLCDLELFRIKIDALNCHESQYTKCYFSEDVVYATAKMRAAQGGFFDGVAEAYEIVKLAEF